MPKKIDRQSQVRAILKKLKPLYAKDPIEIDYETPFQLVVGTILSAQCTDKRVNLVTKTFFNRLRQPQDFLKISQEELETLVKSTGFYKNKAKNIRGAAQMILNEYDGHVPERLEDLIKIPGFGRKTANVIQGELYGRHEGIAVDTHVLRLSQLLGLSQNRTADKVERDLMAITPESEWSFITHVLILHGRRVCFARKPSCQSCCLKEICPSEKL
jgi:endonuclease-3